MADITMWRGEKCRVREECYRYTAKPKEQWQSYFAQTPIADSHIGCDHYIDNWFRGRNERAEVS